MVHRSTGQKYAKVFNVSTLKNIRQFYLTYRDYDPIRHAVRGELEKGFSGKLGWIHYRALMRVDRPEARVFYEIEAEQNKWSGRELERQIGSLLFDQQHTGLNIRVYRMILTNVVVL